MASPVTSSASGTNWKPGGVQARPPKLPAPNAKSKKSTFYRAVLGQDPIPVEGTRYPFASNYAHPNDKAVVVEDLRQVDIDSAIRFKFEAILPRLLHDPVGSLVDTFSDFAEDIEYGFIIEIFDFFGLKVERRTYKDFDVYSGDASQYSQGALARKIEEDRKQYFDGEEPPPAVVQYIMAEILAELKGILRGRESDKWKQLTTMAQGRLYRVSDLAAEVARCQEILDGSVPMPTQVREHLTTVRKKYKDIPNKHHQLQIDRACAEVCDVISDKDVVILRDKHHQLIAGGLIRATQQLAPTGTLERLDRALRSWAWRYSISEPDRIRHGTHYDDHLVRHPEKDIELSDDPHNVANGTDHYGLNFPTGHSNLGELQCQVFAQGRHPIVALKESLAFTEELPKLREGLWGWTEKEVRLTLKAWDPNLYNELVRMWHLLPPSLRVTFATTGDNPHQFLAQLVDVQTEGHTDSMDMKRGLAAIKCFGDFTGGDLVFKELGVRIKYLPGSHFHLRGCELHHSITQYEGTRHCIVLTVKEAVVRAVKEIEERIEKLRGTAEVFRARGLENLTDEEVELVKASESDDDASEYIYGLEHASLVLAREEEKAQRAAKKVGKAAKDVDEKADEEADEAGEEVKQEVNRSVAAKRTRPERDEEEAGEEIEVQPKKPSKRAKMTKTADSSFS